MQVVYICVAIYRIVTGTPASRGPSATPGLLVNTRAYKRPFLKGLWEYLFTWFLNFSRRVVWLCRIGFKTPLDIAATELN